MDNLNNLEAIWHSAKTDRLPNAEQMLVTVKKFRYQRLRNKWLVIVASCLLACLMIAVLIFTPFKLSVTYIGGYLILASCILLAATNLLSLKRFYRLEDCSNLNFLAFLEQTRQNQLYYYKKTQVIIMLFSSAGLLMYLYEAAMRSTVLLIIIYSLSVIYLIVIWFLVRPRAFKKQSEKLKATTERLKHIARQLNS
ncbi:hypothetical protein [Mucilaginibacter auburnensis]|uniref:Uncharacterized protein n=1 Tax=Mucilaginibacter auburnensis TaxID=1457233 RepID=A0A2H9VUF0_9SPHI|nr:hypothetical protein [Mucilaginibacter auburnensis]PJJ84447.1 hypothetical protein CLV57_1459 [Mucilaginibacter auburnensis]